MKVKIGQIVAFRYYDERRFFQKLAIIRITSLDNHQKSITGDFVKHNYNQEISINICSVIDFHIIAEPGESVMYYVEIYPEWYNHDCEKSNLNDEIEKRFKSMLDNLHFLRIDDEYLYIVYREKAEKINRLWGNLTYLIGPIDRCPDNGRTWRKQIEPDLLKRGIIPLNPLEKPIDLGIEDDESRENRKVYKQNENYQELSKEVRIIRHVDLRLVDRADFIICYLDTSIHMCGTYEELFWANRLKSPIIVVCPQGKQNIPDWLFGTLKEEFFFSNFEDALKYIDYIDSSDNPEHLGRWLFIDYKKLYGQIQ